MNRSTRHVRTRARRPGTILIVTMFICFTVAGVVLVLCRNMRVEAVASANLAASIQASSVERGAEQYVLALLTEDKDSLSQLTDDDFAAIPVGDGYFWILRPAYPDDSLPQYGLTDENAKLNINIATNDALMRLPNMTDDLAAAIIDWRDADSTPTAGGAENEYYMSLSDPYACKNAPFESVEELLMVRGVTRELLYGTQPTPLGGQANGNRIVNNNVTDQETANGLYDLLTIYSSEPSAGQQINVNDRSKRTDLLTLLGQKLSDSKRAQAIIDAMRDPNYQDIFDFYFKVKMKQDELTAVYDSITAAPVNQTPPQVLNGNLTLRTTTTANAAIKGRINVNMAPRDVLLCLPGLESSDVDTLISARQSNPAGETSVAWVAEALKQKAVGLGDKITGKSYQYSADILAVSGNGRAFKRVRIVVNASGQTPQILYRRDISDRGWPMDQQILTSLRAGQGPGAWANARSGNTAAGGMLR
jgi:type II secretory pathway component PulK